MIYVIATIETQPGMAAQLIEGARTCIDATRREAGCISYDYVQDTQKPDTVLVVERWITRDALAAHMLMQHLKDWREVRKPLVLNTKVEVIHAAKIETL